MRGHWIEILTGQEEQEAERLFEHTAQGLQQSVASDLPTNRQTRQTAVKCKLHTKLQNKN